ncbi:MAG: hypothetical protein GEU93_11460 [Propionibacteriales bacterium]|nr:hypothetical protein [Propionibacteriales bacterium]
MEKDPGGGSDQSLDRWSGTGVMNGHLGTCSPTPPAAAHQARTESLAPSDLWPVFAPRSVAVVGASEDSSKFGGRLMARLVGSGFGGDIWPVNPRRETVMGIPAYPTLGALPGAPDHVAVAVPSGGVVGCLEDAHNAGAHVATVFSGGYAELGTAAGGSAQTGIVDVVRRTGLRVIGPNCNGIINVPAGFALTTTATLDWPCPPGRMAVVSQSGGLGQVNVMWNAHRVGVGVSHQISSGNDADLGALDFARYLVSLPDTGAVALVLESIRSGWEFAALAVEAAERGVPLLLLKIGRSEAGARAALSHTGAVTGSDDVVDAACQEFGVIRVRDADELVDAAQLFSLRQPIRGRRLGGVSVSGGNNALLSDLAGESGFSFPALSARTSERLSPLLPDYAQIGNPLDATTAGINDPDLVVKSLSAVANDPVVDVVVSILTHVPDTIIETLREITESVDRPHVALWVGGALEKQLEPENLVRSGIPTFSRPSQLLRALESAISHHEFLIGHDRERLRAFARPQGTLGDNQRPDLALQGNLFGEFASIGLPLPAWRMAGTQEEATAAAATMGYPVALKICSPSAPHKTDFGLVRLGLADEDETGAAFDELVSAFTRSWPGAAFEVLVQRMAEPGLELLLGGRCDPVFGPVVVVGMGGVLAEVFNDRVIRLAPVSARVAEVMLRELRANQVLDGVRGASPSDVEAAAQAISDFSRWLFSLRDVLEEVDINPLIVHQKGMGVSVVDGLVTLKSQT